MFRALFSLRTRHQPYMVRLSYRHELRSALTFPLAASLAEGSFTGVVAAKNFQAGVVLMSVITAAPMFGNITALIWSDLSLGRRKVPLVNMLQLGVILMIASVALLAWIPLPWAGRIFAGQIIIARLLASGIITIRSSIWRANYPRAVRGQITSRIATAATFVLAVATFAGSFLLDRNPRAFVFLYPTAALLGAIGIWQFSGIRVRREKALNKLEQLYVPRPENMSETAEANVMNYEQHPRFIKLFAQAFAILRENQQFRKYQWWQFLNGASFMMYGPSLLYMVSRQMTDPVRQYLLATTVMQIIPMVVMLLATQLWAPLFDRVHITRFRVYQGMVSVAAQFTLFCGATYGLYASESTGLAIVALGQVLVGISNGAGNLAWNLGHNDFCSADQAGTYMGVHVMLTGLRGSMAPFFGSWLYLMPGVGRNVFAVSTVIALIAQLGFWSMARSIPPKQHAPPIKTA